MQAYRQLQGLHSAPAAPVNLHLRRSCSTHVIISSNSSRVQPSASQQAAWRTASSKHALVCRADAKHATATAPAASNSRLGKRLGPAYSEESNMPDWHKGRRAGVILHPTSLPGSYGIGELGQECFRFIDWLQSAGMQCWQVLPLVPPDPEYYSPYSGLDTNCGNPLLIDLDALVTEGLLQSSDLPADMPGGDVQFEQVAAVKNPLLQKAAQTLLTCPQFEGLRGLLAEFRAANPWIEDSALFDALRQQPDLANLEWWNWPEPLRFRKANAIKDAQKQFKQHIDEFVAIQFMFDRQWRAVKVILFLVSLLGATYMMCCYLGVCFWSQDAADDCQLSTTC
eukprot:GHUV01039533.1.p1 GENE.GHUV01039533.1~~GHUV01039533.1.p1  ORF type:complete len:339 (-),score=85.95 GHUV01039533.1:134-1150(-)